MLRPLTVISGQIFIKSGEYGKLKSNGSDRHHSPAYTIFDPASVGVKLKILIFQSPILVIICCLNSGTSVFAGFAVFGMINRLTGFYMTLKYF